MKGSIKIMGIITCILLLSIVLFPLGIVFLLITYYLISKELDIQGIFTNVGQMCVSWLIFIAVGTPLYFVIGWSEDFEWATFLALVASCVAMIVTSKLWRNSDVIIAEKINLPLFGTAGKLTYAFGWLWSIVGLYVSVMYLFLKVKVDLINLLPAVVAGGILVIVPNAVRLAAFLSIKRK